MSLGDLTKQLAGQALSNTIGGAKTGEAAAPDNIGLTIVGQLQAMQKALKEDEELIVLFRLGGETIVVREIFLPTWTVAVLGGVDGNKNMARAISPVERLQLICKVIKVAPGSKANRLGLFVPKAKNE